MKLNTMPPPSLILIHWGCIGWKIVPTFVLTTPSPVLPKVFGLRKWPKNQIFLHQSFVGNKLSAILIKSYTGSSDFFGKTGTLLVDLYLELVTVLKQWLVWPVRLVLLAGPLCGQDYCQHLSTAGTRDITPCTTCILEVLSSNLGFYTCTRLDDQLQSWIINTVHRS